MIDQLLSPEVQKYIKDHQNDDPFLLSLNAKGEGDFPLKQAIEQIHSLQKAKFKLPSWVGKGGIVWPKSISIEQASSELTARFKAEQIRGKSIVDLTGGMGVDVSFFAEKFDEIHYVELDKELADLTRHNFEVIGKNDIKIHNQSAEVFLENCEQHFDCIYIDPSRRDKARKVFIIEDCTPNLFEIMPKCLSISNQVLVKLSPMVDLSLLTRAFSPSKIWIVSIRNEVKEVLCLIKNEKATPHIIAVDLAEYGENVLFEFDNEEELSANSEFSLPLKYLYEPSSGIMKAGAFKLVGKRFGLKKLHVSTHLYTSEEVVRGFPGRVFLLKDQLRQDKKELARLLPNKKINVLTRNYPLSAEKLKQKIGLKDGGEQYLIGATLMDNKKVLLYCDRI